MTQLSLFGDNAIPVEQEHIDRLSEFTDGEKTWLKGLTTEFRPLGIAFLQWKKSEFKRYDKLSRPQLWMEGFLLGRDMAAREAGGELGNAHAKEE